MVRSREEAAKAAEASKTNEPGACQKKTRGWFDAPSAGDQDHDGDADAVDGWKSEPRAARHVDRNPPRGVPVAWSGGSHGYGHRAISLGGGKIRSTDAGGSGKVATVDLDWPEKHWGLRWLGWSDTIDGQAIPGSAPPPKPKGLRVVGIDLYHGNPVTEAALRAFVKASSTRPFVALKATEGSTIKDKTYGSRRALVEKVGAIPCAYAYGRPDHLGTVERCKAEGVKEARYFLDYAEPKPGDLRSMLDLEDRNGLGPKLLTAYVDGWVHEYERQVGCLPFIYTHFDLLDNFGCPLWASRYNDDNRLPEIPEPWKPQGESYVLWQFSDGEDGTPKRAAGFKAHAIDLNTIRRGLWLKDFLVPEKKPPPPPPPDPTGDTFVNAQFNSQHTDQANRQIRDVLIASDLVGLNEVESLWQRLILKTSPKFGVYPTLGTGGYVPVCWRKSVFKKVDARTMKATDGVDGASPTRNVVEVDLRHRKTGKVITRRNTQVNPHIEVNGRERRYTEAEKKKYPGWLALAKTHFTLLRRRIVLDKNPSITGGDFNVAYDAEKRLPESKRVPYFPYTMLTPVAKPIMPKGGSHGSRRIDWVLIKGSIRNVRGWLGDQGASDHKPVFNELELT